MAMNKLNLRGLLVIIAVLVVGLGKVFSQATETMPRDLFYDKSGPLEKEIIPYDHIREADVFWHKRVWRTIDANEKMNLPFRYEGIDWKDLQPLINILRTAAISNEITVYDDDNFQTIKTAGDVQKVGAGYDTIPINDLDGNYVKDTVIIHEFNPASVTKYRLKEDWFFDEETSTMQVRIMAIAPIYRDEQGPN
jgi:gliding motility associated protien GldN